MQKWGLFHYHFLAKNLGVVLTSVGAKDSPLERSEFNQGRRATRMAEGLL